MPTATTSRHTISGRVQALTSSCPGGEQAVRGARGGSRGFTVFIHGDRPAAAVCPTDSVLNTVPEIGNVLYIIWTKLLAWTNHAFAR